MSGAEMSEACRALRKDAQRNRERVLAAAAEAFAEDGLEVPLEEIARRAGVGIATLYRRFPSREQLIDAVFAELVEAEVALAAKALAHEDPWEGFAWYVEQLCAHSFDNRGFNELMSMCLPGASHVEDARRRRVELVDRVIARAREHGGLRPDFVSTDLAFVMWAHERIAEATREVAPQAWRRFLALMLDACRTGASLPLPRPPLTPEQMQAAMRTLGGACSGAASC